MDSSAWEPAAAPGPVGGWMDGMVDKVIVVIGMEWMVVVVAGAGGMVDG